MKKTVRILKGFSNDRMPCPIKCQLIINLLKYAAFNSLAIEMQSVADEDATIAERIVNDLE